MPDQNTPIINVLAPLQSAGDFPVTTADQVHMSLNDSKTVADIVAQLQNAIGIDSDEISVKGSLTDKLDKLREYITTLIPPTLSFSAGSNTITAYTDAPSIDITWKINRPLESPLIVTFNGEHVKESEDNSLVYTKTWQPNFAGNVNALPAVQTVAISLIDENNNAISYGSIKAQCTFATNIYYGASVNKNITDISSLTSKLSAGHVPSLAFTRKNLNVAEEYYYYAAPASYGEAKFSVGAFEGGFIKESTFTTPDNITYNLYRTEYTQTDSLSVNITKK
jgi:hypothetical protein